MPISTTANPTSLTIPTSDRPAEAGPRLPADSLFNPAEQIECISGTNTARGVSAQSARNNVIEFTIPPAERQASVYCTLMRNYIADHDGKYIQDEMGHLHLLLEGNRIPLTTSRDNYKLTDLMLRTCSVTTLSPGAQAALQRLATFAHRDSKVMHFKRFSTLSNDERRLYIPLATNTESLLRVTKDSIETVPNGSNDDAFWVEHPRNGGLGYRNGDAALALADFERLLVDTQACTVPEMRWFVAMHEGLLPFVREMCRARLIAVHLGASQSGKTTGAQRFIHLHGLGEVSGDYSVAALGNMPDPGLLVLDNKEQTNFTRELIDYCLSLATGAERARSNQDGTLRLSGSRPIGVITSIEGVVRVELQKRCVNIDYGVPAPRLKRGPIEREIAQLRHQIGSALMMVLQRYLAIRLEQRDTPNPIPEFEEHFVELCNLLWAYAEIAGKSRRWAADIISTWDSVISGTEAEENDLEGPIWSVLLKDQCKKQHGISYDERLGCLYVTEAGLLLDALMELRRDQRRENLALPVNAAGLTQRLKSSSFGKFTYLPCDTAGVPALKRTSNQRPIGFFVADDEMTQQEEAEGSIVMAA